MSECFFGILKTFINKDSESVPKNIKEISSNNFYLFLRNNDLFNFFYASASEMKITSCLPSEHSKIYKMFYTQQWLKNERILQQMKIINDEFSKNNIPVIFFKGVLLAHQFYGDISKRTIHDIDMLILEGHTTVWIM